MIVKQNEESTSFSKELEIVMVKVKWTEEINTPDFSEMYKDKEVITDNNEYCATNMRINSSFY